MGGFRDIGYEKHFPINFVSNSGVEKKTEWYCLQLCDYLKPDGTLMDKKDIFKLTSFFVKNTSKYSSEKNNIVKFENDKKIIEEKENNLLPDIKLKNKFMNMKFGAKAFTASDMEYDYDVSINREYIEKKIDDAIRYLNRSRDEKINISEDYADYGIGSEIELKIFSQINKEKIKNSCFYNSLLYYGINDKSIKGIQSYSNIINYLLKLNRSFVIYFDSFIFNANDLKSMQKILSGQSMILDGKKYFIISDRIKNEMVVEFKNVATGTSGENTELIRLCLSYNNEVCHIFVPDENPVLLYNGQDSIFKMHEGKAKKILKDTGKKEGHRYIFYDLETAADKNNQFYFKPVCISITYFDIIGNKTLNELSEEEVKQIGFKNAYYNISYELDVYKEL
jgi:hypothetical protein